MQYLQWLLSPNVKNQVPLAQPDGPVILHQTLTKADMIPDGWNDCVRVLNKNNAHVKLVASQSKNLLDLVSDWQKQKRTQDNYNRRMAPCKDKQVQFKTSQKAWQDKLKDRGNKSILKSTSGVNSNQRPK